MELSNEHKIAAPKSTVWTALNDPAVLRRSIPGCESIEQVDERTLRAQVRSKVGPIGVSFRGVVELSDIEVGKGYNISFRGEGGAAGFVKGNARVDLRDDGDGTLLDYKAQAQIGGRLAQIGSRLIDSVAAKTAGEFFDRFTAIVAADEGGSAPGRPATAFAQAAALVPARRGSNAALWSSPKVQRTALLLAGGAALLWLVTRPGRSSIRGQ